MRAHIVTLGASTPLGLTAEQCAYGLRAGLFCPRAIAQRDDDGHELGAVLMSSIPEEDEGWERMVSIALPALREALDGLPPRTMLFLALPNARPGFDDDDAGALRNEIRRGALEPETSVLLVRGGNEAFGKALALAMEHLESHPSDYAIVGAVDSWHEANTYAALDRERRILSGHSFNGFLPSEGAGFVGIAGRETAATEPIADVVFAGFGDESPSGELDEVWTDLVARASQAAQHGPMPWVLVDQCTERHRARSWDRVAFRLREEIDPQSTVVTKVAEKIGDIGAASGAVMVVYAAVGLAAGFAPGPAAVIALGSDQTGRSTIGLRAR